MWGKLVPSVPAIVLALASAIGALAFSFGVTTSSAQDDKANLDRVSDRVRVLEAVVPAMAARLDDIRDRENEIIHKLDDQPAAPIK